MGSDCVGANVAKTAGRGLEDPAATAVLIAPFRFLAPLQAARQSEPPDHYDATLLNFR